jgi:hypothetical protein
MRESSTLGKGCYQTKCDAIENILGNMLGTHYKHGKLSIISDKKLGQGIMPTLIRRSPLRVGIYYWVDISLL